MRARLASKRKGLSAWPIAFAKEKHSRTVIRGVMRAPRDAFLFEKKGHSDATSQLRLSFDALRARPDYLAWTISKEFSKAMTK